MTIASLIYLLCSIASIVAAVLLARQYRTSRTRLLFWSACGFAGLALNNAVVFIDLVLVPATDLSLVRTLIAVVALGALLYGITDGQ
jgi:hypothetical protein